MLSKDKTSHTITKLHSFVKFNFPFDKPLKTDSEDQLTESWTLNILNIFDGFGFALFMLISDIFL